MNAPENSSTPAPAPTASFVTGATGLIGRHLVARLLERSAAPIYVLVREASIARFEERCQQWGAEPGRVKPVLGDLTASGLGLSPDTVDELRGKVRHFFHVAALYDMKASDEALERANVAGTRNAVEAASRIGARCFHHVSSIAAAGRYPGVFREDMFEEATDLEDPYFRTKHESERVVRNSCRIPWRIYRPSVVVGHSETGEMDKIDGPYYFFPFLERLSASLPPFVPLPGVDGGLLNIVPVDFVADALDHIAHQDGWDGKTFHLVDPEPRTFGDVFDVFAEAAGAPRLSLRIPGMESAVAPISHLLASQASGRIGRAFEGLAGIPPRILAHTDNPTLFDCSNTLAALEDSEVEVPPLERYAPRLWSYWARNLDANTQHDRKLDEAVGGLRVLITGASSGIGRAAALKLAAAGAHVILVARNADRLAEVKAQVERVGGKASIFPADLSDAASATKLCEDVVREHGGIDVLVNNAGRSIRRSLRLSVGRIHDFERTMAINYFGAVRLVLGFLPAMRSQRRGQIINVSSVGTQVGPPRFSAYIASKSALEGFSKCAAPELLADNIHITTIHMPLVKTDMIAPTGLYDSFSVITPAEAADMICDAIVRRPKRISSPLGVAAQVSSGMAPEAWDVWLHLAYRLFPDSAAARGDVSVEDENPTSWGRVFARLLPGVHW
jgi:NAD(P)-dependent dehydrogenase (short-subunit alcohol dehydrogenase family)